MYILWSHGYALSPSVRIVFHIFQCPDRRRPAAGSPRRTFDRGVTHVCGAMSEGEKNCIENALVGGANRCLVADWFFKERNYRNTSVRHAGGYGFIIYTPSGRLILHAVRSGFFFAKDTASELCIVSSFAAGSCEPAHYGHDIRPIYGSRVFAMGYVASNRRNVVFSKYTATYGLTGLKGKIDDILRV